MVGWMDVLLDDCRLVGFFCFKYCLFVCCSSGCGVGLLLFPFHATRGDFISFSIFYILFFVFFLCFLFQSKQSLQKQGNICLYSVFWQLLYFLINGKPRAFSHIKTSSVNGLKENEK